jgi:hypothetical protein
MTVKGIPNSHWLCYDLYCIQISNYVLDPNRVTSSITTQMRAAARIMTRGNRATWDSSRDEFCINYLLKAMRAGKKSDLGFKKDVRKTGIVACTASAKIAARSLRRLQCSIIRDAELIGMMKGRRMVNHERGGR